MILHDSFKTFVRDEYPNEEEIDAAKIVFVKFCDDLFQNEIGLTLFDVNYNHMNMLLCKRPNISLQPQKYAHARTSIAPHWQAKFKSFLWVGCETPYSSNFSIWVSAVIVISQAFAWPRGGRIVAMSMRRLRCPFLT